MSIVLADIARAIVPAAGVKDQLGTPQKVWEKIYVKVAFDDQNRPYLVAPIDASVIGTGEVDPARIAALSAATNIVGIGTLAQIAALAAGGGDPAATINAGITQLLGEKIADGTLDPSALDAAEAL